MTIFPHFTSSPWTAETDFSGTIEAVGSSVNSNGERFKTGDEVFGSQDPSTHLRYGGTAREYLIFPADLVMKKPANLTLAQSAALGANACTALLFIDVLKIKKGDKILVTAASGSLGSMLIPLIRATVGDTGVIVGVCSGANTSTVKSYGADEVIDYKITTDLPAYLKQHHSENQFNAIIDIAGTNNSLYTECPNYLTKDGTFLIAGMVNTTHAPDSNMLSVLIAVLQIRIKQLTPVMLGGVPRRTLFERGQLNAKYWTAVKRHAESGVSKVDVTRVWEMEELLDAYAVVLSDDGHGRHLLHIQD